MTQSGILVIAIAFLVYVPTHVLSSTSCPAGFTEEGDSCFYGNPNAKVSWDAAFNDCVDRGARLVWIDSDAKRERVRSFLETVTNQGSLGNRAWIGGKRVGSETRVLNWIQPDGATGPEINVDYFYGHNPDNWAGQESAVEIYRYSAGTAGWNFNDLTPSNAQMYVCEIPPAVIGNAPEPREILDLWTEGVYMPDYTQTIQSDTNVIGWSVYIQTDRPSAYFIASVWRLVSGTTYSVVGYTELPTSPVGVHEIQLDEPIAVQAGDVIGFSFSGGSTVPFDTHTCDHTLLSFAGNHPMAVGKQYTFPVINSLPCRQYSLQAILGDATPSACPTGFVQDSDTCFYTDVNNKVSWDAAFSACTSMGARLAWVDSVEKRERVRSFLETATNQGSLTPRAWIGGKRVGSETRVLNWIEASGATGPEIDVSFFYGHNPDNWLGQESAVEIYRYGAGWNFNDHVPGNPQIYVCERPAESDEACDDSAALAEKDAALQQALQDLAAANAEIQRLQGELDDALSGGDALAQAQQDLADCQAENQRLQDELDAALAPGPEPVMPTASPTATLSDTAYEFRLDLNQIDYILETTPMHIALESDDFCETFGMKLAQVENEETLAALALQFVSLQSQGVTLAEIATGERSSVNLDKDIVPEAFNAAGWNCGTFVPDGSTFKMVGKKCQGERAVLCAAVPLYC